MLKKEKIIRIVSIVFISIATLYYGTRVVYYYLEANGGLNFLNKGKKQYTIAEKIIAKKNVVNLDIGLNKTEDGGFVFVGKVDNNFLNYNGQLWRVMSIDSDNNLTLVLDTPITALRQNGDYQESSVLKWLNDPESGVFIKIFEKPNQLMNNFVCTDSVAVDDVEKGSYACGVYDNSMKIGILDIEQYLSAGATGSYLNSGYNFWLANKADEENYWFVSHKGGLNYQGSSEMVLGIKPTITISGSELLLSGKGTDVEPYYIEDKKITKLKDAMIGDYVQFSDSLWKIVSIEDERIKLVADGYVDGAVYPFSNGKGTYSLTDQDNIGYFLNTTFLDSLSDKELIVEGLWNNGGYSNDNKYDYTKISDRQIKAKVGMLNIADLYLLDYASVYTMTKNIDYLTNQTLYIVTESFTLFEDNPISVHKIRPAVYINANTLVSDGLGSMVEPYLIGGGTNE